MIIDEQKVKIENLCMGAVLQQVNTAMNEIFENISDSQKAEGAREIHLKIKFEPDYDREVADVKVECKTKLQGTVTATKITLGHDIKGRPAARENLKQQELRPFATSEESGDMASGRVLN